MLLVVGCGVSTADVEETHNGKNCTLSGGEVVEDGWSGKDTGSNFCNQCKCLNGGLGCTKIGCPPVELPASSTPVPPKATPTSQ